MAHSKIRISCIDSEPRSVTCFARFTRALQGEVYEFAVTREASGVGQCLTHVGSGRKVCALGVPAAFLPAYAKLKTASYRARGELSLDALIAKHGEARIRSVIASVPDLPAA
jgi:hypothetical protein